jgi:iron complex outermembrane receptor protein
VNAYQTFAPTISKQFEVGAKTEFETWSTNLALFRVDRGLQYLNSNNVFVQNGQTRYQGIDWSAQMSLSQNWTLLGGVMYLDASNVRAAAVWTASAPMAHRACRATSTSNMPYRKSPDWC